MKKNLFFIFCALFLIILNFNVNAQNIKQTLLKSNSEYAIVRVDYLNYETSTVFVNGEMMQNLSMENAYPLLRKGAPELLQSTFSLIVPENSNPSIEILDSQFSEIQNFNLAPSKGMLYRNVNPADVPYFKGNEYNSKEYVLNAPASISNQYQLRDFHGIAVKTYPFDYNPKQHTLKVYSSVTLKVNFNGTKSFVEAKKNNKTFDDVYSRQFLNYNANYRSTPITEEGKMLIIVPDNFMEAMQPYVDWKTKIGYEIEMVALSTVGNNSTAVKNYVSEYYNNNNLAFLLIVGDSDQFPAPVISGDYSDNYLTELAGNDYYPDIILGKISAETVDQVETQVQRFIEYEKNPSNTNHFSVFCGIASQEGGSYSDNGEIDWQHIRNINNKLSNFTYTSGYEFFEGSQGGLDASGNPTANSVAAAINDGVGIITYCGHGDWNMWVSSSFNINNVNSLTNKNKLPFVLSVACVNGEYAGKTCFAETWMRATKDGEPTGAVGYLGSTINQSWNPPMRAQDAMVDILIDTTGTIKKVTFGGMFFNGMIKMLDAYSTSNDVSRTWILFGDPTLLMRTAVPQQLQVEHPAVLPVGVPSVNFETSAPYSKICVTCNGEIIASGSMTNGEFQLELTETYSPSDTLFVTATAQNYLPYEGIIEFVPNDGPYVLCKDFNLIDNGNNNGKVEYGETVSVSAIFSNVGNAVSDNATVTLSTTDEYITINNGNASLNPINPNENTTIENAFSFNVAYNVPNNHKATLKMMIISGNDTTISNKNVTIYAPILSVKSLVIDDSEQGNGNGRVDYEEIVKTYITVTNNGGAKTPSGTLQLSNPSEELYMEFNSFDINALETDGTQTVEFQIKPKNTVTEPVITYIRATYTAGAYSDVVYFPIKIGAVVEDWESGDFSQMSWENNSSKPWFVTTQLPYEGSYCLRSGQITHNGSTQLKITSDCNVADTISFFYKVSCEANYDYLSFSIDGQEMSTWSGTIGWTRAAFPVDSGTHTFAWTYKKDYYMSSGSDCAWIDYINFPAGKIKSPVSIEDFSNIEINVTPNPTQDFVYVDFSDSYNNASYTIFDLSGKLLSGGQLHDNHTKVSLINYPKGVYIINILEGNNIISTKKIIKQ